MRGITHLTAGLAAGAIILNKTSFYSAALKTVPEFSHYKMLPLLFLSVAGISAIMPDIDIKNSLIRRKLDIGPVPTGIFIIPVLLFILASTGYIRLLSAILLTIYAITGYLTPHRTFTHSLFGSIMYIVSWLFVFPSPALSFLLFVGATVGYLSHILLDLLTVSGINFFYPLDLNVGLRIAKTAGLFDYILMMFFTMLFVWAY